MADLLQLGHLLSTKLHLLLQHAVLLCQHVHHLLGPCHHGVWLPLHRVRPMAVMPTRSRARPLPSTLSRSRSLLVLMLMLVLAPGCRAVGVLGESVAPLHRWVRRATRPIGVSLVGTRAPRAQGIGIPVVGHGGWGMAGAGCCGHQAAEGGGLGTGQRAHRRDRRGGAVVVEAPLGVQRALLTGPVGKQAHKPLSCFMEEQKQPVKDYRDEHLGKEKKTRLFYRKV